MASPSHIDENPSAHPAVKDPAVKDPGILASPRRNDPYASGVLMKWCSNPGEIQKMFGKFTKDLKNCQQQPIACLIAPLPAQTRPRNPESPVHQKKKDRKEERVSQQRACPKQAFCANPAAVRGILGLMPVSQKLIGQTLPKVASIPMQHVAPTLSLVIGNIPRFGIDAETLHVVLKRFVQKEIQLHRRPQEAANEGKLKPQLYSARVGSPEDGIALRVLHHHLLLVIDQQVTKKETLEGVIEEHVSRNLHVFLFEDCVVELQQRLMSEMHCRKEKEPCADFCKNSQRYYFYALTVEEEHPKDKKKKQKAPRSWSTDRERGCTRLRTEPNC